MLGVLVIRKETGCTSHDIVNRVRKVFGTKRVGHAGTLDPQASGVLVVAVGPATRFLQYLPLEPKGYVADFTFGAATSTYDLEGEVTFTGPVPTDIRAAVEEMRPQFMGLIEQLPPMFSAVKLNGKPLYAYARQGKELDREPRTVHVGAFDILGGEGNTLRIEIECSGGTYIRSLAHDLGQALGCGAHLSRLERTRVGKFFLKDAVALENLKMEDLIPLKEALPPMPLLDLNPTQTAYIRDGRTLILNDMPEAKLIGLVGDNGQVVGIGRRHGNVLQPDCVIPIEAGIV
ncbi:MAG: tRNA pseudouridine(55) synthase TruB [Armatimonadetes bacterium]|nr:tRNA pseudouridine(55) synthase TruB [Armatimonadota bacterium]